MIASLKAGLWASSKKVSANSEIAQVGKRARRYRGEVVVGWHLLYTLTDHTDVRETKLTDHLCQESTLFLIRLNQSDRSVGVHKGQRQSGKSGSGADIGQGALRQVFENAEGIKQMVTDPLARLTDRREVVDGIPFLKQVEVRQQTRQLVGAGLDAEGSQAIRQCNGRRTHPATRRLGC